MVKWLTDPRRARPAYAGLVAILLLLAARTLWRRLSHAPAGIDFLPLWTAAGFALDRPDRLYDFAYVTQAQRWLLSISASDRVGLLYSVARVLARHHLNLQLAKVSTLGERVEDSFLISGPELQGQKAQLAIETELLEALDA